jgi:hypothetical protein
MDASRLSLCIALFLLLATSLPGRSQTPKPSVKPQSVDPLSADKNAGPFNSNCTLIVNGVVNGLTPAGQLAADLDALTGEVVWERIRVMPCEVKEPLPSGFDFRRTRLSMITQSAGAAVRKTYALGDIGDDPSLSAWITATIPQIIQPGTWNAGEAHDKRVLSYFAPAKILVVLHTPATHVEIEEFLRSVKKSLPQGRAAATAPQSANVASDLTPAQFTTPVAQPLLSSQPAIPLTNYAVPAQRQQPKHLFHFIIRYEGDGVIDANIVDFMKAFPKDDPSPNADDKPRGLEPRGLGVNPMPSAADTPDRPDPLPTSKKDSIPGQGTSIPMTPTPRRPVIVPVSPSVPPEAEPTTGTTPPAPR